MAENRDQNDKSEVAKREEKILRFWEENEIFQKSLTKPASGEFVFYDGPPFATGLPHYGHLLAGTIKDAIPRYQTMKGKLVRRRWGWDCHGLPLENIVEQELNLETKKDILNFGIKEFNKKAREAVLRYAGDWQKIIPRLGRWVDMKNDYRTMDASYTEAVWGVFKQLYDKGLVYEGFKSMHLCPRCGTTLSNFEVNQGYQDVKDLAVTVELELVDEPGTCLLAWTTTPWTLPGNVALAVNPEIKYAEIEGQVAGNKYIVAISRAEQIFGKEHKILREFSGRELVGKKYKTPFDYYLTESRVYGADFVTTEEGTGIVHIAPAFGEDDHQLLLKENLPFIQHVGMDGRFKPEVRDFAGRLVKPKDNPSEIDIEIIRYLDKNGLLFAREKVTHSYPHCWRCETPLLNYATSSWFVKVVQFKDKLVKANNHISWVPEHIKEGRFGKWLEGARDWAISRSRFWGAPIPVWRCGNCDQLEIIGSLEDLKNKLPRPKNNYWAIRHGLAQSNADSRVSSKVNNDDHLLPEGVEQVKAAAKLLAAERIDLIISSDFHRTKETAEILAAELGLHKGEIIFDQRLWEIGVGSLEGGAWNDFSDFIKHHHHDLSQKMPGGESVLEVRQRMLAVISDLENKHQGKKILIVSHGLPIFTLLAGAAGVPDESLAKLKETFGAVKFATPYPVELNLLPRNEEGALDLHRPFIDNVKFACQCGGEMGRVPEVFDCWFESGSMPYFDNPGFPADFIAEGLDQTRGWFYSLLVLGVALKGESPYKNVIANGLVLAENGQKMSKRLKNYPDPLEVVEKYGADALRFYLLSAPVVRAEDLNFSEKGVAETGRKIVSRLLNVLNFYQTYSADKSKIQNSKSEMGQSNKVLDTWIISRLNQTIEETTKHLDNYELDRATRSLDNLIDDLSNWYLRRSRERFKSDDINDREAAMATTRHLLRETDKLLAPFTPFLAEEIYQTLKREGDLESVHLTAWPKAGAVDDRVIEFMKQTRLLVERALAARAAAGMKVRQPLAKLTVKEDWPREFFDILAEEVNVKEVVANPALAEDLTFDFEITPQLKLEGEARELIRQIQEERKKLGLKPGDAITLSVGRGGEEVISHFEQEIKKSTNASELNLDKKLSWPETSITLKD